MIAIHAAVERYRARAASQLGRVAPEAIAKGPAAAGLAKRAKGRAAYGEIAKTMAELRRAGLSCGAIANELNNDGKCTRYGAKYTQSSVRRILSLYA